MPFKVTLTREFDSFIGGELLNLGCGESPEPGWTNVDFNPVDASVLKWDLRATPWPVARGTFGTVKAVHLLEHFRDEELFAIMHEIGEVLKVGGHLIGVVPYATHSMAYANPFHKQLWDQSTPSQFARSLYELKGWGGGAHQFMPLTYWKLVEIGLIPDHYWRSKPIEEITEAMGHRLNVIAEMWFVMRKEGPDGLQEEVEAEEVGGLEGGASPILGLDGPLLAPSPSKQSVGF